jgi:CRP-like cAMP-binding protein
MSDGDQTARAQSPTFELGPQSRERLLARYRKRFVSGDTLLAEGAPAREALLLQEGKVSLVRHMGGSERCLAVLKAGDLVGEGVLIEGAAYASRAVALTDGFALALDRATLVRLLERHPEVALRVVDQLVRRLRDAEDRIEILMTRGVQSKVVGALLKLVGAESAAAAHTPSAEVTISPIDLSMRVGLDIDTVKRIVQRLRDKEYLRIQGERIEVGDVEALRRLQALLATKDELAQGR